MDSGYQTSASRGADVELARAAGEGDPGAQQELANRLLDRTRATVTYLAGGHRDVDDMVQICLMQVLRSAGSFRGESRLERWADRIVVRTTMSQLRGRRRSPEIATEEPLARAASPDDQEQELARRQLRRRLAGLLHKLSPERRIALTMSLVHDYRVAEIAEITGAPVNTVKDRLKVGRRQLRKHVLADPALREWARTRRP